MAAMNIYRARSFFQQLDNRFYDLIQSNLSVYKQQSLGRICSLFWNRPHVTLKSANLRYLANRMLHENV